MRSPFSSPKRLTRRLLTGLAFAALLAGPAWAQLAPEPASRQTAKQLVTAQRHMVVAANPLAAAAGQEMLRQGGSAVDAAIATELVLGLVEPQSSGLGGGGFLVLAEPGGKVTSYDGRETAGAAVTPDLFIGPDGKPLSFPTALKGGRAVGVPGLVAMMAQAHAAHGKLPWAKLFEPAIRLAEAGVPAQPRMVTVLSEWQKMLATSTDMQQVFYRNGAGAPALGEIFAIPGQLTSLRLLAKAGPEAFYRGPIAQEIVAHLKEVAGPNGPPVLSLDDFAAYKAVERDGVCIAYRVWKVCGMGPPSGGGIAVLQILALLAPHDLKALGKDSPQAWHLLLEASRRAHADREAYIGDPDHVAVPIKGLLDKAYLAERARGIDPTRAAIGKVPAGSPPTRQGALSRPPGIGLDLPSTTHISIVDDEGRMVSMTNSVEFAFGSGLVAAGMVLNNELTDFAFVPVKDGVPVSGAVGPGRRPRSSMSPMVVFDAQGRPVVAVGSPGGAAIIGYVAQALVAMLDWGLDPQQAVNLPILLNRNGATQIESLPQADRLADALAGMGHEVKREAINSGVHAIRWTAHGWQGGADPRRDGVAVGD
ncbi:gamma-glutamyltransferase 1 Threonine peptidase. MEROPS family T03 [Azospirillum sp. RU38E]|nr:gamma-glutamyltransferase [Azospirillum sp. RU37A]SNR90574.1 gamma-glutamyltransferase 1 Threonine peptidase. MEROPS family T03 [Azospirillum sp. RU38E]SNS06529.1 gamma-glutamyltransferase 1 Threonine peptidase. MEROPS family T03 [Azospirillum sp. RU37A]